MLASIGHVLRKTCLWKPGGKNKQGASLWELEEVAKDGTRCVLVEDLCCTGDERLKRKRMSL